jgi:hypothetical protein
MSFVPARMKVGMNAAAAAITHVIWSEDGIAPSANVPPTATAIKDATEANPSVIANDGALESAPAEANCVITHFAFAQVEGETVTPQTTWNELELPAGLNVGGKITVTDGYLSENWHQTSQPPE